MREINSEFGTDEGMIAGIDRVVQILNSDIASEEMLTRIFDRTHVKYAMLARTLHARRDNLRGTIAALEKRPASLQGQPEWSWHKRAASVPADSGPR
jgi:hypothetical protein